MTARAPTSTLFPYTTLFRSSGALEQPLLMSTSAGLGFVCKLGDLVTKTREGKDFIDRKSTRLNSSHTVSSYAVFCLNKKNEAGALRDRASIDLPEPDAGHGG